MGRNTRSTPANNGKDKIIPKKVKDSIEKKAPSRNSMIFSSDDSEDTPTMSPPMVTAYDKMETDSFKDMKESLKTQDITVKITPDKNDDDSNIIEDSDDDNMIVMSPKKLHPSPVSKTEMNLKFCSGGPNKSVDAKNNLATKTRCIRPLTIPFRYCDDDEDSEHMIPENTDEQQNDEIPSSMLQGEDIDDFLSHIESDLQNFDPTNEVSPDAYQTDFIPESISFTAVRASGGYMCGTYGICKLPHTYSDEQQPFLPQHSLQQSLTSEEQPAEEDLYIEDRPPAQQDIIKVLLEHRSLLPDRCVTVLSASKRLPDANGSALSICLWAKKAGLAYDQTRAFQVFTSCFVLSFFRDAKMPSAARTRSQAFLKEKLRLMKLAGKLPIPATQQRMSNFKESNLVCFLHGPGGNGKSAVLEMLQSYAREYCKFLGYEYTKWTIIVSAMSGVAATLVGGYTTHSAVHLNKCICNIPFEDKIRWKQTRLLIVDEISFASKSDVQKLDARVKYLKDSPIQKYGGLDIIFCGDMRQLQPANGYMRIYDEEFPEFHGSVNCYLELNGMHIFSGDMAWGKLLSRFCNGELTSDDVDLLNTRVVDQNNLSLPVDLRYACFKNIDRVSINTWLFLSHVQSAPDTAYIKKNCILILSSNLQIKEGDCQYRSPSNGWEHYFWHHCGEGYCKPTSFSGRFDPAMLLFYNRPVMVTNNENVEKMIANGTRSYVRAVHLKPGESYTMCSVDSISIPTVRADQIQKVVLAFENSSSTDETFELVPKEHTFIADVPYPKSLQCGKKESRLTLHMQGLQLPFICNNATKGHKLHGASVASLFVHTRSMVENWSHVVLSRVRTMTGLYLKKPLEKRLLMYHKSTRT